jgi:hypothetical protein
LRAVVGDVEASREAERRKSGRRLEAPSATGVDRYHIVEVMGVRGRSPRTKWRQIEGLVHAAIGHLGRAAHGDSVSVDELIGASDGG